MFFKRIEMHGFKSFAEPVTIEFDRGITCVVGPNGSGKSNISDAIRWVLGEQSPKMLRGGKMEDVIFAGTASRKSRGMAEVTLVIDNTSGRLPVEYSEVAITRRMYRSGESEYAINNNPCRMRDIRELIMDTGIGVDGYSLIGQGKIAEIISNKTESIREIFEETAGIVSYRSRKAEAERKLASASVNMDRVQDIITEIESRIDGLRTDSEKAEEYIGLRDRHKELEVNIIISSIDDLSGNIRVLSEDMKQLQEKLDACDREKNEVEKTISDAESLLNGTAAEAGEMRKKLEDIISAIADASADRRVGTEKLNGLKKDIHRLERECAVIEEKLCTEAEEKKRLEEILHRTEEEYREIQEKLEEQQKIHGKAVEEHQAAADRIEEEKNRLFTLSAEKSAASGEMTSLKDLLENLKSSEAETEENIALYEEYLNESRKRIEEAEARMKAAGESGEKAESKVNELEEKIRSLRKTEAECRDSIQKEGIRQGQLISRKKTIEEMEANYEGYNSGVRFVMKRNMPGIHGTVADLIDVPHGYETALETALGGTMQNIVCSDEETAKKAVNLLKEARAGRVTLLPVTSVRGREEKREKSLEAEAGFCGYGTDCVSADSRYDNIIKYLLGNVVVVETMDDAMRISRQNRYNYRLVTLDGEIVNRAGALTGGQYKNRTANILERKGEISVLEEQIEESRGNERKLRQKAEESENKAAELLLELEEMKNVSREREREISEAGIILSGQKNRMAEIESTLEKSRERKRRAGEDGERAERQIAVLEEKIAAIEKNMKDTEKFILDESEKIQLMGTSLEEASDSITEWKMKVNDREKDIVSGKEKIADSVRRTDELEEDRQQKRNLAENIKADCQAIEEGMRRKDAFSGEKQVEKEQIETALKDLERKRAESSAKAQEAIRLKEELSGRISAFQGQKYEIDVKLARQEGQLDSMKSKLWDEFELSYAQAVTMKTENFSMNQAVKENRQIRNRIRELGEVNVGAIKEYRQVSERYSFLCEQRDDIQKSTDQLKKVIDDLDRTIRQKFRESFDSVVKNFEEIFVEFFGGGHGMITLENEDDPLSGAIEITAQPPGKQLRNINLLSGGEKTMTAIALMFAVLKTKPAPCCILDEVEAALDDHNIHVFANYLRKFDDVQFTLITHQKTTMEHADVMYGVTMPERGISRVYSLKMGQELPDGELMQI